MKSSSRNKKKKKENYWGLLFEKISNVSLIRYKIWENNKIIWVGSFWKLQSQDLNRVFVCKYKNSQNEMGLNL